MKYYIEVSGHDLVADKYGETYIYTNEQFAQAQIERLREAHPNRAFKVLPAESRPARSIWKDWRSEWRP